MFERFTKAARAVVTEAQQHVVATTPSEVRPEHLLLGPLRSRDQVTRDALADVGLTHRRVREAVVAAVRKAG